MAVSMSVYLRCNSQSIEGNYSNVTAWCDVSTTNQSYNMLGTANGTCSFWGNWSGGWGFNATFDKNRTTRILTHTNNVTHNADGTGSVGFSVTFNTRISAGTITKSTSLTLPTIPRASTPTASGTKQLGQKITINTNRAASSFTHTLKWSWGGKSGTIATGVGASTTWTPAIATFAPYLTNKTSDTCTITCTTYSGSTNVGSKTITFSLSIPSSVVPSISGQAVSDTTGYLTTYGGYVKGKSNVKVDVTAAGIYGSTISKYSSKLGSGSAVNTDPATLGTPSAVGSNTISSTVTDSRGRTASKSTSITVIDYQNPTLSGSSASRWNTDTETVDDEATTMRVVVKGSVFDIGGKGLNKATVVTKYREYVQGSNTGAFTQADSRDGGEAWDYTVLIPNAEDTKRYEIVVTATDSVGTIVEWSTVIDTANPIMDFKNNGLGIAFGQPSVLDETVDFNWNINARKPATFNELATLSGGIQYQAIEIPKNADLNDYTTPGFYFNPRNADAATMSNVPLDYAFSLEVTKHAGVHQRFVTYHSNNDMDILERNFYNNTWSSWYMIPKGLRSSSTGRWVINDHTVLGNNIFLQGNLTGGSGINLLGINSSNRVELNWTSGGLRGRCMKLLWSGTWTSGSLTVSEHGYYNTFVITVKSGESYLCTRYVPGNSTSPIQGGLNTINGSNMWINTVCINCSSSTVFSGFWSGCFKNGSTPDGNHTITKIYGVL